MSRKDEFSDLANKLNKQLEEREEKKKKINETVKKVEASQKAKKPEIKEDKIKEKKELQEIWIKEKLYVAFIVFIICQLLLLTVCFRYPGQFFAIWAFGTFSICIICIAVIDLG